MREEEERPLFDELHNWLEAMAPRATPKSPLGKAIGYARNRWLALCRHPEAGRLEIDNGEVERLIRRVARAQELPLRRVGRRGGAGRGGEHDPRDLHPARD